MYIAFFDSDKNSVNKLHSWLVKYTVVFNTELEVLWFENATYEKASKYVSAVSIAFISLDCENLSEIGVKIAESNPNCYICYYKKDKCDLFPMLHSRPYDFFLSQKDEESFIKLLNCIINEYKSSKNVFLHETKRGLWCYPVRSILYLQSDMKYVNIVTGGGKKDSVYAKLSQLEEKINQQDIGDCFVRVHKSYIVNAFHIKKIDKTKHTVHLFSGEELPISEACYKEAVSKIKKFHEGKKIEK